jgi:glutathione S-transferase
MKTPKLTLVSHNLCPFVQRAAIALLERDVPFERRNIDLGNKPDWFLKLSPLGNVPLLLVDDETVLFESLAIAEYINDLTGGSLLDSDALTRSRQRAWIEFASATISNIGKLYAARDNDTFDSARAAVHDRWQTLENNLNDGPYFSGENFSLVDAAFAPVFRYFDVIEMLSYIDFFVDVPKVRAWRNVLATRPSVQRAVSEGFPMRLLQFFAGKDSVIGDIAGQTLADMQRAVA